MLFDVRTLLVAVTLAAAFCTAARFLLCKLHPALPGLRSWAWGGIAGTLALGLITARGLIPEFFYQSFSLLLLDLGTVLGWDGFRRFAGRGVVSPRIYVIFTAGALIPMAVSLATHRPMIHFACNTALLAVASALAARDLLKAAHPARTAMRATAWLACANAALFTFRTVAIISGRLVITPLQNGPLTTFTLLWWLGATIGLTLGMVLMASERLQYDLDQQASRDPLTGAFNRRAFVLLAEKEQARSARNEQPLAVIMMDLDHFKMVNDHLGHAGGDAVLRLFVAVLDRMLRGQDVFCRFGGEEFLALLPGSDSQQALLAAERIRVAFAEEAKAAIDPLKAWAFAFSVSIGIGELQQGEALESAIRRADAALYQAKAAGRNRCELALPAAVPAV